VVDSLNKNISSSSSYTIPFNPQKQCVCEKKNIAETIEEIPVEA
jgi:hypothetical protein